LSFPQHLLELDPKFWEVLQPYIAILSSMVDKNVSLLDGPLRFLLEFKELLSFRSRWTFFTQHQSMKRINDLRPMEFRIQRATALDDSFAIFRDLPAQAFLSPFVLTFVGEPGIDAGGLTRNWLVCVVRDLLHSNLFKLDFYHRTFFPTLEAQPETLLKLRFTGRVIARAVTQNQPVPAFFSRFVLKELMAAPPMLCDLAGVDPDIYTSLKEIMEDNDVEDMGLTFAIIRDGKEHELTPGGAGIEVTNGNRREYVELALKFYLERFSGEGLRALIGGFHDLIPAKELCIFDADELEWVMCGRPKFDMKDFKANLGFIGEYGPAHPVILRFFEVLEGFATEMRLKFLGFVTNSALLPAAGFGYLPQQIKICPRDGLDRLPSASTCEYLFYLPPYETVDVMKEKLEYAINNTDEGFEIR
jgi:E3 ubiquitin-protein ligase HUWE1